MATFSFDGSASRTVNFNATVDRAVLDLDVDELASLSENRDTDTVTIVATSGAVLTLVGTNFAALRLNNALVAGFESDIVLDIGTDGFNFLDGNVVVGLGAGDDILGTNGDDLLFGNQGSDLIVGLRGSDRLYGGMANDTIRAGADANDATQTTLAVGGLGTDSIEIAGAFASNAIDAAFNATGAAYVGSATVLGGNEAGDPLDGQDRIGVALGDTGSAVVYGNGGNDRITIIGNGDVTVFGGQGADTINATADTALIYGGLGADVINVSLNTAGDSATVFGGNGSSDTVDGGDVISVQGGAGTSASIYGNGGSDTIVLNGVDGPNATGRFEVFGGQGDDAVSGDVGNGSVIYGGLGIDNIDVDVFSPTPASVTVYGGNGSADADDGADIIRVSVGTGVTNGVPGEDSAVVYGNGGNDLIVVDSLNGRDGQATVYGGAGDDTIDAGDVLDAVVFGGIGSDVFVASDYVANQTSAVTVMDFTAGQDRVDFDTFAVAQVRTVTSTAGVQIDDIADAVALTGNFAANEVIAFRVTSGDLAGSTVVFGNDGAAAATPDDVIVLSGFTGNLTTADFA